MGNPGRRRRPGRDRWLRALISRGTADGSRPSEASPAGLLAEDPAEFGWPDNTAAQRQLDDSAESWPPDPAAYQWLGGWTDQPAERRLLDEPAEPDWATDSRPPAEPAAFAEPAGPAPFAQYAQDDPDQPGPGRSRRRRAGWLGGLTQRDWYQALVPYRWYVAVSAGAGAVAVASGIILLLPHSSPRAVMADSRVASRPAATPSLPVASPIPDVSAHTFTPTPAPSTPAPTQSITGPAAATPATSAPGFVTVTYQLVQHWEGGIIGKYTIINESNAVLSGWQFTATFPGDQVQFVIGAADPDLGSDVLVLEPASAGAQLVPGGRVSVVFFAAGQTASPVQCSFNRTAC
jgi:Cellulose binding domain